MFSKLHAKLPLIISVLSFFVGLFLFSDDAAIVGPIDLFDISLLTLFQLGWLLTSVIIFGVFLIPRRHWLIVGLTILTFLTVLVSIINIDYVSPLPRQESNSLYNLSLSVNNASSVMLGLCEFYPNSNLVIGERIVTDFLARHRLENEACVEHLFVAPGEPSLFDEDIYHLLNDYDHSTVNSQFGLPYTFIYDERTSPSERIYIASGNFEIYIVSESILRDYAQRNELTRVLDWGDSFWDIGVQLCPEFDGHSFTVPSNFPLKLIDNIFELRGCSIQLETDHFVYAEITPDYAEYLRATYEHTGFPFRFQGLETGYIFRDEEIKNFHILTSHQTQALFIIADTIFTAETPVTRQLVEASHILFPRDNLSTGITEHPNIQTIAELEADDNLTRWQDTFESDALSQLGFEYLIVDNLWLSYLDSASFNHINYTEQYRLVTQWHFDEEPDTYLAIYKINR